MSVMTVWSHSETATAADVVNLLEDFEIELEVVDLAKAPPDEGQIRDALALLEMRPIQLVRKRAPTWEKLSIDPKSCDDSTLIPLMTQHPSVLRLPVVFFGGRAEVARPAPLVLRLLAPSPTDEFELPNGLPKGLALP